MGTGLLDVGGDAILHSRRSCCSAILTVATGMVLTPAAAQITQAAPKAAACEDLDPGSMPRFLEATEPNASLGQQARVFDRYAGSWELDCAFSDADGGVQRMAGEWHFGWILGGRAMQDVLYFYPSGQRPVDAIQVPGGSTVRLYDAKSGQWNVTWCPAVSGVPISLQGGEVGDRIILLGRDIDDSLLRWSFSDVTAESFLWRGEISKDSGLTWRVEQTMNARRSRPASFSRPRVLRPAWGRMDRVGLEVAEVRIASDRVTLTGEIAADLDAHQARLQYEIACNGNWEFTHGVFRLEHADDKRQLILDRGEGTWRADGILRPDLHGCIDVDFMGTPSTNTLPIRRLAWAPKVPRELQMAFIRLPGLTVGAIAQRYTLLANKGEAARRFRYESVSSGFKAELDLDADDLVLSYPPYWSRAPRVQA